MTTDGSVPVARERAGADVPRRTRAIGPSRAWPSARRPGAVAACDAQPAGPDGRRAQPERAGPSSSRCSARSATNHPKADLALIERAYRTAEHLHGTQMRKSGDPYITHPLAVATILADIGMTEPTLVAALLHDTVEDTAYTLDELRVGLRRRGRRGWSTA